MSSVYSGYINTLKPVLYVIIYIGKPCIMCEFVPAPLENNYDNCNYTPFDGKTDTIRRRKCRGYLVFLNCICKSYAFDMYIVLIIIMYILLSLVIICSPKYNDVVENSRGDTLPARLRSSAPPLMNN